MIVCDKYQAEFPRSKKRRVRQKWAKQARRYRETPYPSVKQQDGLLVLHPRVLKEASERILRQFERKICERVCPQSGWSTPISRLGLISTA